MTNVDRSDRGKTVVQTLKQVGAEAKRIKKAAGLSKQGMDKSQVYGVSAVGADPKTSSMQKSNLATASGALHKGSSRTLAIAWIYGSDAHPDTRNPLLALRAWLRFLGTADVSAAAIQKAWCKRYSDIQASYVAEDPRIWDSITSAMSASLLHLLQVDVRPVAPAVWLRHQIEGDSLSGDVTIDMRCRLQREENLVWIETVWLSGCGHKWQSTTPILASGAAKPP